MQPGIRKFEAHEYRKIIESKEEIKKRFKWCKKCDRIVIIRLFGEIRIILSSGLKSSQRPIRPIIKARMIVADW